MKKPRFTLEEIAAIVAKVRADYEAMFPAKNDYSGNEAIASCVRTGLRQGIQFACEGIIDELSSAQYTKTFRAACGVDCMPTGGK